MWRAYISILAMNLLLPVLALCVLHLSSKSSGTLAFLQWLTGFLALLFIGRIAHWEVTGLWWPAVIYVLGALLTLRMIQQAVNSELGHLESKPYIIKSLVYLCFSVMLIFLNSLLFSKLPEDIQSVNLTFPLRSPWIITQGGNASFMNSHSTKSQSQSLDVVGLTFGSLRANGIFPPSLDQYAIYRVPVYSPCDGKVIGEEQRFPDQSIGTTNLLYPNGNFVVIYCQNVSVLLAHLSQGSTLPEVGDSVTTGQQVGRVGNSGNSTEPHLHIQAVAGRVANAQMFVDGANPVTMTFNGRYLQRGEFGD
ncbi:M23 family metallopeptidase [Parasalinivibrio latis]|uniref:M23 family metallopeptidase n=1 Tax=Parasalinivibrio latis TaxID=2952610 RepID=UPI0030E40F79